MVARWPVGNPFDRTKAVSSPQGAVSTGVSLCILIMWVHFVRTKALSSPQGAVSTGVYSKKTEVFAS